MKSIQLLNAFQTLGALTKMKLPVKKAYAIYNLAKKAEAHKEFFIAQEQQLIEEFKATILENGQIKFENSEDLKAFTEKHNELKNLEVENCNPITLSIEDFGDANLSAADMASLEGVIDITD